MNSYTTRTTCRVCGSSALDHLFSLGDQYVSSFVDQEDIYNGIKTPITLELCRNCALVQLKHTAPQDFLYSRFYWYRSGVTQTMRDALRDITERVESTLELRTGDVVLDIGSNDGTLLRSYARKDLYRIGVEPAKNLAEEGSKGVDKFIPEFWNYDAYAKDLWSKAVVITALGMFYDLEDPNQFIEDVAKVLDPERGVFIAQLMCLKNMLSIGDVGNLAHEHLEFYSLKCLVYLFGQYGLEIYDIETNAVNGESYRLYCRHIGARVRAPKGAGQRVEKAIEGEKFLSNKRAHELFFEGMERERKICKSFIESEVRAGKKIWVYGASTKGNVILQYYELDHRLITAASDRSPEKWGKYTIGTGIPIVSEEEARVANPDYFLVLPYAFLDEFIAREKHWIANGGRFLVPLPKFQVVPKFKL